MYRASLSDLRVTSETHVLPESMKKQRFKVSVLVRGLGPSVPRHPNCHETLALQKPVGTTVAAPCLQ